MRAALFGLLFAAALRASDPVTALAFHPDGTLLAAGGYREVVLWDAATLKVARRLPCISGKVRALAFSPDGRSLAVAGGVPGRSGTVATIDLATGAVDAIQQSADEMLALAFSPDGHLLATGGADTMVRIFTLGAKSPPRVLKGHTGWVSAVAFSPDGKLFASAGADQSVRVWSPSTWEELFRLPQSPAGPATALAFSIESDFLAFAVNGVEEHAIRLWRTQGAFAEIDSTRPGARNALMQTRAFDQGACGVLALAFHKAAQHSRLIAGCTDNTVRFLGPAGNPLATGTGHGEWVYSVAASPDGRRLVSGSGDGIVKIWNPAGKLIATLEEGAAQP